MKHGVFKPEELNNLIIFSDEVTNYDFDSNKK